MTVDVNALIWLLIRKRTDISKLFCKNMRLLIQLILLGDQSTSMAIYAEYQTFKTVSTNIVGKMFDSATLTCSTSVIPYDSTKTINRVIKFYGY